MAMRLSILRVALFICALPLVTFASNSVVNMSHYDRMQADFAGMKSEGILAVIHEATYPPFTADAYYSARQQAAARNGLLWGAYHFANASDPVRQADHYLSVVSRAWSQADPLSRPSGVLLVLDFEKNGHYPGGTMRVDQAVAFVERIRERTGKYPGIYSGEYHARTKLGSSQVTPAQRSILAKCWLWLANYSKQPRAASPWDFWHLWQYCGDGRCKLPRSTHPISIANVRKAERNIFNGSRSALQNFWQERAWFPGGEKPRREPQRTLTAEL
jgi:lysozyme